MATWVLAAGLLLASPCAAANVTASRRDPTADSLATNSPGCGTTPPSSGWVTISVPDPRAGLTNRRFRLYVPPSYDNFASTPLVLDFHGYSNLADRHEDESGIRDAADTYTFIAVFPEGLDDTEVGNQQAYSWNSVGTVESPGPAGDTCQWADSWGGYACHTSCRPTRGCYSNRYAAGCDCSTCADDVLFTELMINWLEDELCIDQRRVHVTGFSNGGMMAYQLAQSRLGLRIASIAPLCSSPLIGFDRRPSRPMAVLTIQGTTDRIIPANCSGNACGPAGSTISSDGFCEHLKATTHPPTRLKLPRTNRNVRSPPLTAPQLVGLSAQITHPSTPS
jgi:poly(3-hydroxybutyrate) depolymerase